MSEAALLPERPFLIAARRPGSSCVQYVITTATDAKAARRSIEPGPREKIGVALISDQEWLDLNRTGAQPIEAMRLAVDATR